MKIRDDVPLTDSLTKWAGIFETVKHGQSIHVDNVKEAQSARMSFINWAQRRKIKMKTTWRRVDATDPDGVGYRIWFVNANGDAK